MNLRIISWNINMFSPPKLSLKTKLIEMINIKSSKVDFIFLIESSFEFVEELLRSNLGKKFKLYQGFALSHGGFIHLLYREKYENSIEFFQTELPVVIIKSKKNKKDFYLCGCHLYPFAENMQRRISELIEIRNIIPKEANCIIIGDTNMREKEINLIYKNDLFDLNYYKNKKPTWYAGFFDKEKMKITSRYDKLFYSKNMFIEEFELFGNKNSENKFELLSDHLAISAKIKF